MSSTVFTSAAPAPSSTSRVIQVEIPPSTVLAIGLGFVGLVFALLVASLGTRIYRVRRRMAAVRATGQTMNFSDAWQRDGGMFSFLSSMNNNGLAIGAGSSAYQRGRERLWGGAITEKERPVIWDVPIREKAGMTEEVEDVCEPFALSSTISPRYVDRATPAGDLMQPRFTFSLLISLPRDPSISPTTENKTQDHKPDDEEEDWPELPEVLIGTAQLCPMIFDKADDGGETAGGNVEDESLEKIKGGEDKDGLAMAPGAEAQALEYVPAGGRPARWERYDVVKWRIEGLR